MPPPDVSDGVIHVWKNEGPTKSWNCAELVAPSSNSPHNFGYVVEHHSIENGKSVIIFAWQASTLAEAKASARNKLYAFGTDEDYFQICKILDNQRNSTYPVWAGNSIQTLT